MKSTDPKFDSFKTLGEPGRIACPVRVESTKAPQPTQTKKHYEALKNISDDIVFQANLLTSNHNQQKAALKTLPKNARNVFSTAPDQPERADVVRLRDLVPPAVRRRRFRAKSFAASLDPIQRATLLRWFAEEDITCAEIARRAAAPAPNGFGIKVNITTLLRLKSMIDNAELDHWVTEAMDAASDLLHGEAAADVAPLRESLLIMLYSRALNYVRKGFLPGDMNHFIAAIARLERLRPAEIRRNPRLQLDLNILASHQTGTIGDAVRTRPSNPSLNQPAIESSTPPTQPTPNTTPSAVASTLSLQASAATAETAATATPSAPAAPSSSPLRSPRPLRNSEPPVTPPPAPSETPISTAPSIPILINKSPNHPFSTKITCDTSNRCDVSPVTLAL